MLIYIILAAYIFVALGIYFGTALFGISDNKYKNFVRDIPPLPNDIGMLVIYWPFTFIFCFIYLILACVVSPFILCESIREKILHKKLNTNTKVFQKTELRVVETKDHSLQEAESEVEEYLKEDIFAKIK